jgi:hypothetical protein
MRGATLRSLFNHELRRGNCQRRAADSEIPVPNAARLDRELQIEVARALKTRYNLAKNSPVAANSWAEATTSAKKKPGSIEPGLRYWPGMADTITFQEG